MIVLNLKEMFSNYIRILKIAKKPDTEEYFDTFKMCVTGISMIGAVGFIFYLASVLLVG